MQADRGEPTDLQSLAEAIRADVPHGQFYSTQMRQIDQAVEALLARDTASMLFSEGRLGGSGRQTAPALKAGNGCLLLSAQGCPLLPVAIIGHAEPVFS